MVLLRRAILALSALLSSCTPPPPASSPTDATTVPTASMSPSTSTSPSTPPAPTTARPEPTSPPAAPPITADQRSCKQDDECVFVSTSCCDVCNGGTQEAVNRSSADAVSAQTKGKLDCTGKMCTRRGCTPQKPVCRAGSCSAP